MSARWCFGVRGEGSDTIELDVYDVIGEDWWGGGVTAKDVRARLQQNRSAKAIKVRINSAGGDVIDGLAIYNLLNEHPAKVEVQIDALAASMASVIAMAGDEIRIAKNAFVMIHNPWGITMGGADEMRGMADLLDKMRANLADIYVARTGSSRKDVLAWMEAETWMTADEAKERGFVTAITPAKKMAASVDLSIFTNVPEALKLRAVAAARPTRADHPTTPPPAGRDNEPGPVGKETKSMAQIPTLILVALALPETADEMAVSKRVGELVKLEQLTGKTGDDALGVAKAWKESHDALPKVAGELATVKATAEKAELETLLKSGRDEKKLTKAMADKLRAQVEAYAAARAKGEEPQGDAMSLAAAKSFVATLPVIERLAAEVEGSRTTPATPGTHNGKTYEQFTPGELANLRQEEGGEETYQALRADWIRRGRPKQKAA